ncbi:hypothetical protein GPALN_005016 [Globodera pallida]|nr:hypothetical protein GPALN_005016 [Globodera pallida]
MEWTLLFTFSSFLLLWLNSVSSQFMYDCLPPGRYFASAPAGPPPLPLPPPIPAIMAAPPAFPIGCAPVARLPVLAAPPPPPPLLRSPAGFMPSAAVPAFAPAAAFPGIMPAAAFPGMTAAAALPAYAPAAAFPGFLPTYSPAVALPAAPLLRMPPAMCGGYPRKAMAKARAMARTKHARKRRLAKVPSAEGRNCS